jgi:hypothetical protein
LASARCDQPGNEGGRDSPTYKVYGRFSGDLTDHVRFFADAAWAVMAVKEK